MDGPIKQSKPLKKIMKATNATPIVPPVVNPQLSVPVPVKTVVATKPSVIKPSVVAKPSVPVSVPVKTSVVAKPSVPVSIPVKTTVVAKPSVAKPSVAKPSVAPITKVKNTFIDKTNDEIMDMWMTEMDFEERDQILKSLQERKLFPQDETDRLEKDGGLYPDVDDPLFIHKLLNKREFAENKQKSMAEILAEGEELCDPTKEFELSPVQRFISTFLSPDTPYNSTLLFHGVGVGKTCAAISTAEAFLNKYPRKQVIIIAPPNIQSGFERTIFDINNVVFGTSNNQLNETRGCTGNTYLELSNTQLIREKNIMQSRVTRIIRKRYVMYGYLEFYNYVTKLLQKEVSKARQITPERRNQLEVAVLQRIFSNRFIIIDEAHNLRDVPTESTDDNIDAPGGEKEIKESEAGKKLTPVLRRILEHIEGTKLMLLTATPMYNSYREIIFLFNLLLRNDKKAELSEAVVFGKDGRMTDIGKKLLGNTASAYMSFMRGENPLSFPVRLEPQGVSRVTSWPLHSPKDEQIPEIERTRMVNLPLIKAEYTDESLDAYMNLTDEMVQTKGMGVNTVDLLVQAGNWLFPGNKVREDGFSHSFSEIKQGSLITFKGKGEGELGASWLQESELAAYSPKAALLLRRLRTSKGVAFVYSRFVKSGALTLALALEANGYTLAGSRDTPLLQDGLALSKTNGGRQCALCPLKEDEHRGKKEKTKEKPAHAFVPAKYVLLTGRDDYSPNNKISVELARRNENRYGAEVKVILGSQVASEGIDLRFIREIYVFDSWFHLNKLEQVLGRGIRMCSHALLKPEERNCTIHLLVNTFPESVQKESMDMYMYRIAMNKAVIMGALTRFLKINALDCNLNRDAILIQGLPPRKQEDSQGVVRPEVNVNDMPYTSLCDWIETCDYTCAKPVDIDEITADTSTYNEYSAQYKDSLLKNRLRQLFSKQVFYTFNNLKTAFEDVPEISLLLLLSNIVDNRNFQIKTDLHKHSGYITYRNGFYLFQPDRITDTRIPIALRVAAYPVKVDVYSPLVIKELLQKQVDDNESEDVSLVESQQNDNPSTMNEEHVLELWNEFSKWFMKMKNGGQHTIHTANAVLVTLEKKYSDDKKKVKRISDNIEMMLYFYNSIQSSSKIYLEKCVALLHKYVWDELLTNEEQRYLFSELNDVDELISVFEEQVIVVDDTTAFRVLNPFTGNLEYYCDEKLCNDALIRIFENKENDPFFDLKANVDTTGKIYGTVNIKRGNFVFKTNTPALVGKKMTAGAECSNVSAVGDHTKKLTELTNITRNHTSTPLFLDKCEQKGFLGSGSSSVKINAVKICILTDLLLRLMDSLELNKQRWFYRPISTHKSNHLHLLTKK